MRPGRVWTILVNSLCAIVAADDTRVKFVNDLLVDDDEEEEF